MRGELVPLVAVAGCGGCAAAPACASALAGVAYAQNGSSARRRDAVVGHVNAAVGDEFIRSTTGGGQRSIGACNAPSDSKLVRHSLP